MKPKHLFLLCILSPTILSCSIDTGDHLSIDNIRYIKKFNKCITLDSAEKIEVDIPGVSSLAVQDSLLIVTSLHHDGCWSIFSIPEHENLGRYINLGKGRGELTSSPRCYDQSFSHDDNMLVAHIYDFSTGRLFDFNVTQSILDKKNHIKQRGKYERNLFAFRYLQDSMHYQTAISEPIFSQQTRQIVEFGKKRITTAMQELNSAEMENADEFNVLSTYTSYSAESKYIAEACMQLNQINIFSIENDTEGATICCGDKLDDYNNVANQSRAERMIGYKGIVAYPKFFAATYLPISNIKYHVMINKKNTHKLQIFDWQAIPLCELTILHPYNSFDIDFNNGCLYTLNYETEEIYRYDIKEVLEYVISYS